jgi:hypothetical protein
VDQIGVFLHCPCLQSFLQPGFDVLSVLFNSQWRDAYILQFALHLDPIFYCIYGRPRPERKSGTLPKACPVFSGILV